MVEVMEKTGFKSTEIGQIPEDWNLVSYNDAFDFLTTATYSRAQLSENEEIGYVHYGDIHTKCINFLDFDKISLPTIKKELLKNYPTIKDGDVIVADASEDYEGVGKSVEVRNLKHRKAISGLHTFLLRNKNQLIADGFKGYIHSNKLVKKQMDTLATGLKVYGVSKTNLKKIQIPLPPTKAEQTAIATALNDADVLITQLEKLISKKRNIKQGAMQELLTGKKRLPGFEKKKGNKQTEIGVIPSDWEDSNITQLIKKGNGIKIGPFGSQLKKELLTNSGYKVYGQENVYERDMEIGKRYISKEHFDKLNSCVLLEGDFIISMMGTIGKCMIVPELNEPGIMDSHLIRLRIDKNKLDAELLLHFFSSEILTNQVKKLSVGGIMEGLSSKIVKSIVVPIPPTKTEQTYIAQILSDMDTEIEALEKKVEKYKMIKQGMMQNLLTGKVRLV